MTDNKFYSFACSCQEKKRRSLSVSPLFNFSTSHLLLNKIVLLTSTYRLVCILIGASLSSWILTPWQGVWSRWSLKSSKPNPNTKPLYDSIWEGCLCRRSMVCKNQARSGILYPHPEELHQSHFSVSKASFKTQSCLETIHFKGQFQDITCLWVVLTIILFVW